MHRHAPRMKAWTKSAAFCTLPESVVSGLVFSSTCSTASAIQLHTACIACADRQEPWGYVANAVDNGTLDAAHTFLAFKFIRMSSFIFSVTGVYKDIQLFLSGVNLCCGTVTCTRSIVTELLSSPQCNMFQRLRASYPSELHLLAVLLICAERSKLWFTRPRRLYCFGVGVHWNWSNLLQRRPVVFLGYLRHDGRSQMH